MILIYGFEVIVGLIIFGAALSMPWSWFAFIVGCVGAGIGLDGITRALGRAAKTIENHRDTSDQ